MQSTSPRLKGLVDLLVFDFDGVLTDNRVLQLEDGSEAVVCNRADGLAFDMFRAAGLPVMIMSTEKNRVVAARARKLRVPALHAVADKGVALRAHAAEAGLETARIAFVGNDLNDLAAFAACGIRIAVADAHPAVLQAAGIVLRTRGGDGVAREIAEDLLGITRWSADA